MRAGGLIVAIAAASCGGGGVRPTPFTHADPAFALDVPAGYQAQPLIAEASGGMMIPFERAHETRALSVSWRPAEGTAAERRDSIADGRVSTGATIVGKGELPGGGVWLETEHGDRMLEAFLVSGDQLVTCQGIGAGELIAACKTLRPR